MAVFQYILGLSVVIVTTFVLYFKWCYGYWRRRNIPYIEPKIPLGIVENPLFMEKGLDAVLDDACRTFRSTGKKFGGIYFLHKPTLVVIDPDLIKPVLGKDFQHFRNRGNFVDEKVDPLSASLLNLEDDKWKNMRAKLTPTFASGKMKIMFDAMLGCGHQLIEHINDLCTQEKPLCVKEVISCYGTDVIGTCAFGIECNSFTNPDAEFRKYGRKTTEIGILNGIRIFLVFALSELNKILKLPLVSSDVTNFFRNAFNINASHGQESEKLSLTEMVAHSFLFFLAGFETTSTNITFGLYELALHADIQHRLREEILEVLNRYDGQLTYDGIMEMKYMDQVIDETLRKYPSAPYITRKCSKTYPIPGTDTVIEAGTSVFINVRHLQRNEEYFPNPEKFDPERFSKENKANMHPYAYIPFGDGPRVCIGQRFAIMQIKVALSLILKNFKMLPHKTTQNPIKFSINNMGTWTPEEVLMLNLEFYNTL